MGRTPEIMDASRAAKYLGVNRETLRKWTRRGEGPPRVRKGKRFYYVREVLKEWLSSNAPRDLRTAPAKGSAEPEPLRPSRSLLSSPTSMMPLSPRR
jgi:excisionase family DNA binding protein